MNTTLKQAIETQWDSVVDMLMSIENNIQQLHELAVNYCQLRSYLSKIVESLLKKTNEILIIFKKQREKNSVQYLLSDGNFSFTLQLLSLQLLTLTLKYIPAYGDQYGKNTLTELTKWTARPRPKLKPRPRPRPKQKPRPRPRPNQKPRPRPRPKLKTKIMTDDRHGQT